MDAKLTKGKWRVFEYGKPHWNNENLRHVTIHYGDNEEHIVDTVYEFSDANLIASAPEMYEFIETVAAGKDADLDALKYMAVSWARSAETLLAKARGEA